MLNLQPASKVRTSTFRSKGQSLLEVIVLIGLALIIVTGLTIVTVNGLRNSQFSQNQAQATRLAHDAIDKIRTMRDQNCPVKVGFNTYYWYDNTSVIWSAPLPTNTTYRIEDQAGCGLAKVLINQPADIEDTTGVPTQLQTTFRRFITMEDFSGSQKKINVVVEWTDFSGDHKSDLSTIIGQN